jgi:hypothetical protein
MLLLTIFTNNFITTLLGIPPVKLGEKIAFFHIGTGTNICPQKGSWKITVSWQKWQICAFFAVTSAYQTICFESFTQWQYAHRFFHLGVHVPFYLHFWGYIQIFGGAMYPLTLHWGVQRKWTAFSPHKVVHHAVFCKY